MTIVVGTTGIDGPAMAALREWQHDDAPLQLHPGDLGWFRRWGADAAATAVRTWSRDGRILAVGLLDGPDLLRVTLAPDAFQDDELARRLAADATDPDRAVLPPGPASIEAPPGSVLRAALVDAGWELGEPWTPLRRATAGAVQTPGLRTEVVGPAQAELFAAVMRAAFEGSTFTAERWHALSPELSAGDARCLLGFDADNAAVACATAWSAGPGRPGLLEPVGVHRDHRRRGHGRAIALAAVATLAELGASTALVTTPTANKAAVATYLAAGFTPDPEIPDITRH